jgi:MoxR-like ATPase
MTIKTEMTRGMKSAADIAALVRARNPLIWIVSREEARVEQALVEAAASANYVPRTWDVADGVRDMSGEGERRTGTANDPGDAMAMIRSAATNSGSRGIWIMRDLHRWLSGPGDATTCRQLRNLARFLPGTPTDRAQSVIVLSPSADVPADLAGHATVVEWPMPDREEIADILDAAIEVLPEDERSKAVNGQRDAAIDAAVGLSGEEAAACYARSLVQTRKIDPAMVAAEKKRVVARERVLEWFDPIPGGLAAVGGLDGVKSWLATRSNAYTPAARDYGLPAPRGIGVVGVSGCGKSLIAKAIATEWKVPLLRLDLGGLKSKFVGESEQNLRRAFRTIEAIGRCVVWIDEIEKALQGATSGSADGGVSSDALGALLSWMQERSGEAFIIATANDVSGLPPELLRKGRFDDWFFVDLPTVDERVEVLRAALRANGRDEKIDLLSVANVCADFTGAEIAAIVPDAMFTAFNDKARQMKTADLTNAASFVVPLADTAKEKIEALRKWAATRCRPASTPTSVAKIAKARGSRVVDL